MFLKYCRHRSASLFSTRNSIRRALVLALGSVCLPACTIYAHAAAATSTTLQVTDAVVSYRTPVTLTATVTAGGAAVNPGLVKFCDASSSSCEDSALLGTAQLQSNGTATLKKALPVGGHAVYAIFVGTQSNAASNSRSQSIFVYTTSKFASTTTLAAPTPDGQLTATVTGYGTPRLTGNVSFLDATTGRNLGSASLSSSVLSFGASAPQALPDDDVMSSSNPATPANIIQADLNGDGVPDLFFSNQFNQSSSSNFANDFYVKLADPAHPGAYLPGTAYHFNNTPLFADTPYFVIDKPIAIGDFNEDGLPDIAIVLSASPTITPDGPNPGIIQLLMNDPQNPGHFLTTVTPIPVGNDPNSIVVGDFNKDGLPDLAVSNSSDATVGLLLNTPSDPGQFQPMSTLALGPNTQEVQSILVGDFNGDGTQDLAVTGSGQDSSTTLWSSWVEVLYGSAANPGQFSSPARLLLSSNTSGDALLLVGDFNKDGLPDLAVNCHGKVYVALAQADRSGQFTSFVTYAPSEPNSQFGYIDLGDVNGDGILDILGITSTTSQGSIQTGIAALYGDSARPGSFTSSPTYSLGSIYYIAPNTFSAADINGDGLSDWLIGGLITDPNTAYAYLSQPTRTANAAISLSDVAGSAQVFAQYSGNLIYSGSKSDPVSTGGNTSATVK